MRPPSVGRSISADLDEAMEVSMNRPVIIGRNDGCDECEDLGYICDECVDEWLGNDDDGDEDE